MDIKHNPNPLGFEKALTFFKIWTPEMAYVLGLLFADGCITTRYGDFWEVVLEMKDVDFLAIVANTIDPKLRVRHYVRKDGRTSAKISTSVRQIVEDCVKLGLHPRKTFDLEWPPDLPSHLEADFVRGYFDGDGSCSWMIGQSKNHPYPTKRLTLDFSCGSKNFAEALNSVIQRNTTIAGKMRFLSNCYRLEYHAREAILTIGAWMYSASPLRLERKFEKWDETLMPWKKHPEYAAR